MNQDKNQPSSETTPHDSSQNIDPREPEQIRLGDRIADSVVAERQVPVQFVTQNDETSSRRHPNQSKKRNFHHYKGNRDSPESKKSMDLLLNDQNNDNDSNSSNGDAQLSAMDDEDDDAFKETNLDSQFLDNNNNDKQNRASSNSFSSKLKNSILKLNNSFAKENRQNSTSNSAHNTVDSDLIKNNYLTTNSINSNDIDLEVEYLNSNLSDNCDKITLTKTPNNSISSKFNIIKKDSLGFFGSDENHDESKTNQRENDLENKILSQSLNSAAINSASAGMNVKIAPVLSSSTKLKTQISNLSEKLNGNIQNYSSMTKLNNGRAKSVTDTNSIIPTINNNNNNQKNKSINFKINSLTPSVTSPSLENNRNVPS